MTLLGKQVAGPVTLSDSPRRPTGTTSDAQDDPEIVEGLVGWRVIRDHDVAVVRDHGGDNGGDDGVGDWPWHERLGNLGNGKGFGPPAGAR